MANDPSSLHQKLLSESHTRNFGPSLVHQTQEKLVFVAVQCRQWIT